MGFASRLFFIVRPAAESRSKRPGFRLDKALPVPEDEMKELEMESAPARGFIPVLMRGLLIGLAATGFLASLVPGHDPFSGTVSVWASGRAAKRRIRCWVSDTCPPFTIRNPSSRNGNSASTRPSTRSGRPPSPRQRCPGRGRARVSRGWARFATPRFEARLGLQRIDSEAPPSRPLMWFDRVDSRDPLQITDGVKGLLLKYTFRNNANVWAWGLYGNRDPKGWEKDPTARRHPVRRAHLMARSERRGRLERPSPPGGILLPSPRRPRNSPENRIGIDGKWESASGFGSKL